MQPAGMEAAAGAEDWLMCLKVERKSGIKNCEKRGDKCWWAGKNGTKERQKSEHQNVGVT